MISREASSLIQMSILEAEEEKLSDYWSKYAMIHEQDKMSRHLHHIIATVSRIESFVGDRSCDQFLADPLTRDAVLYNIVVVGEASRRVLMTECKGLSAEARQALAEAAAIGDRLPRQYANIDASAVWDAIQVKLPGLKRQLMHWLSARNQATETQ